MINVAVLCTVVLVGLTLLIGVAILLYQQYKFRRKSIDWGDIGRYDTPLEIPTGSNNSSFRSYKYSQLVGKYSVGQQRKQSNSHLYPDQRQSLSLSDIERDGRARGNHSSIKSCPPGVFTTTKQEFRLSKEQQLVQPYYYYRQVVHPNSKGRHSLPEAVPAPRTSRSASRGHHPPSPNNLSPSPQHQRRTLRNPYAFNRDRSPTYDTSQKRHKLSVDYCIERVPLQPSIESGYPRSHLSRGASRRAQFPTLPTVGSRDPVEASADQLLSPEFDFQERRELTPENLYLLASSSNQNTFQQQPAVPTEFLGNYFFPSSNQLGESRLEDTSSTLYYPHPDLRGIHEYGQDPILVAEVGQIPERVEEMLTHQSRSVPTGPPIPGARLNRTYSISSQGQIENAVKKGHRGSSPAIRTFNPEGFSFDVSPESPPPTYHGSRSPSPLYVRAASLDINRSGCSSPSQMGDPNSHATVAQYSSHSMDSYPAGKAWPSLSPNSLCVRRASRCLSPLFIPPNSPKSPTDGNSSSSQPSASSTGPISPMLGSLQLDLYLKKDVTIFLDAHGRITKLRKEEGNESGEKGNRGSKPSNFTFPTVFQEGLGRNGQKSLGKLHFRLKYDLDKSDLNLHVIEAHGLSRGDQGGFNDPFIRVFLTQEVDNRKRETKIHRNESNPFFDENFKFPVSQEDIKEKNLTLQVLDNDRYSRNDIVGEVHFALEDFDITTNLEVWAEIVQNKTPSGEKQEILISLSYLPSAERLTVVLLKARNLHPPDNKDTIDPFVKVYLLGGGRRQKKKKTTARKNSKNPVWNEAFTFSFPSASLSNCSIEISVLDQSNDLIGSHALIGSCMLGPHQNGTELSHWTEMTRNLRQTITMWHVLT